MDLRSGRASEITFALLRFVAGALFTCHGVQKVLGGFGEHAVKGNTLMTVAGLIELVGGILIAVGLLTRIAAFISAGEMAAGYFMAHAPHGFWPIENHGELAVLLCFVFLLYAFSRPGRYSLDAKVRRGAA